MAAPAVPADLQIKCGHCHNDLSAQLLSALDVAQKFGDDTQAAVVANAPLADYLKRGNYQVDHKQQALAGARGFLFQYLHSILHWCDTKDKVQWVKLEEGQDVDVITLKKGARNKIVEHVVQIQYKHEVTNATVSYKTGAYKCIRNAAHVLMHNAAEIDAGTRTFAFEYITTASGSKFVDNWNEIHAQLKAHGRLANGQGVLVENIAIELFNMTLGPAEGKPATDLNVQLHKFANITSKVRGLIEQFSWTLNDEGDLDTLKDKCWCRLKAVYKKEQGNPMQFAVHSEASIKAEVLPCFVGEMVMRIAEGVPARRILVRKDLVDLLKLLGTKLAGGAAAAGWDALYNKHKAAGYTDAFRICAYAAQYSKIADKAGALGGFETDMLLNQYRRNR